VEAKGLNSQDPRDETDRDETGEVQPTPRPRPAGPSLAAKLRRARLLRFFQGGWKIIRPAKPAARTSLFSWLPGPQITEAEVRAEIWSLGTRHQGWPLEGALEELKAPGLPAHRVSLLRACVGKLQRP
jgi:hypothetical protein